MKQFVLIKKKYNSRKLQEKLYFVLIVFLAYIVPAPNLSLSFYVYLLILISWVIFEDFGSRDIYILILLPFFLAEGVASELYIESLLPIATLIIGSLFKRFRFNFEINFIRRLLTIIIFISLSYLFIDSIYFRVSSTGRMHLSNLDPNFSGIGLLLLFSICVYYNLKFLKIFIIIMAIFLLSRSAILSIIIFSISKYLLKNKNNFINKFPSFVSLVLMSNIFLYGLCFILLNFIFNHSPTNYYEDPARLLSAFDESNYGRFIGFSEFYNYLVNGKFDILGNLDLKYRSGVPHNSMMQIISSIGLPCSVMYFLMLRSITHIKYNIYQASLTLSYVFYGLFLHNLFSGYYFLMYLLTVALISEKNNEAKV